MRLNAAASKANGIRLEFIDRAKQALDSYCDEISGPLDRARSEVKRALRSAKSQLAQLPAKGSLSSQSKALSASIKAEDLLPDFHKTSALENLGYQTSLAFAKYLEPLTGKKDIPAVRFTDEGRLQVLHPNQATSDYNALNGFSLGFSCKGDSKKKRSFAKFLKDTLGVNVNFSKLDKEEDVSALWESFMTQMNRLASKWKPSLLVNSDYLKGYVFMFRDFMSGMRRGINVEHFNRDIESDPKYKKLLSTLGLES